MSKNAPKLVETLTVEKKLGVKNRLWLLNILPKEGDVTTLRIVRDLREELSFSEKDHKDFKIVIRDGQITWDDKVEKEKTIHFGAKAMKIVTETLKRLNDSKKLQADSLELFEIFIGTEEQKLAE